MALWHHTPHCPSGLLLAVLAAGLTASCSPSEKAASIRPSKEALDVSGGVVEKRPMERTLTALGSLAPMERATISIKTTGRLKLLKVDVGSPVKVGDVLAQIEPRDYELRLQQSAAMLAQARARVGLPFEGGDDRIELEKLSVVREAAALFEEAGKTLDRVRKLHLEKISAQSELERATADHQVTLNRYQDSLQEGRERQAVLAQRRAEYEIARQQVTDTSLRAPFDGVVQARLTTVGEFLASGSPVLTLVQVDPLRLRMEIPERQASQVQTGLSVRITLEGGTSQHLGRIARVSPTLDDRTRMLLVEAEFKNSGPLRPGSFAQAEILLEDVAPSLAIPADAIATFAGMEKVFVILTNTAIERRITSGRRDANGVEVLHGITLNEVVVRNPGGLRSGDKVRLTNQIGSPIPTSVSTQDPDHANAR